MAKHPPAALRLVCLPPAGGSSATVKPWRRALPPEFTVQPVDLPGRGTRRAEPPPASLEAAAAAVAETAAGPDPYALVGHSLGGLLAFEAARHLDTRPDLPGPRFVVLAGARPPHRSSAAVFAPLLGGDDDELLAALCRLGAANPSLATSPLRALFLPALRADLRLIADYHPDPAAAPVGADLVAWNAIGDPLAPPELGREWAGYTAGRFSAHAFDGDHFFLYSQIDAVVAALRAEMSARDPMAAVGHSE
ncbi:thioesterase II family protein [Actinokineospora sp. 24-640]